MSQPCLKWESSYSQNSDFRTGYTYPPIPPKLMLLLGNVSEKPTTQATAGIFSFYFINQVWKNPRSSSTRGLCQILLPRPPRTTKPQLLAKPIPPSTKLQTQGQMANSNVPFCASFQITLARPDGILCLPGINYNLQVATALPRAITSTSFLAHSLPKLGCPFPWWSIPAWNQPERKKIPWKTSLRK